MLILKVYETICGIPNGRGLFLEPSVLLHLMLHLMDAWDILTDRDGNNGVGEPGGFIRYIL